MPVENDSGKYIVFNDMDEHEEGLTLSLGFKNICRFCLCRQDDNINIFNTEDGVEMVEIMERILKTTINKTDNLPQEMCIRCRTLIESILTFKMKCLNSAVILKKYMACVLYNESDITTDVCESDRQDLADAENSELLLPLKSKPYDNRHLATRASEINISPPRVIAETEKQSKKAVRRRGVHKAYELLYGSELYARQKCSECNIEYRNVTVLIKHRLKLHGAKKFQCLTCGNGFTTMRGLRLHLRIHNKEKREICSICGRCFTDPRTRMKHEHRHKTDLPYGCAECPRRFHSESLLFKHNQVVHPAIGVTVLAKYQCNICANSYMHPHSLKVHMRNHDGARPYACTQCDRKFTNCTSLAAHQRSHNKNDLNYFKEKPLQAVLHTCAKCSRNFKSSSALSSHMLTHTGIKNYMCASCGVKVARSSELIAHMKVHQWKDTEIANDDSQHMSPSSNVAEDLRITVDP